MNPLHRVRRRPGPAVVIGIILFAGLSIQCQQIVSRGSADAQTPAIAEASRPVLDAPILATVDRPVLDPYEDQARKDPLGFFKRALQDYRENVQDYRCTFIKKERVNGRVRQAQTTRVLFKEVPYSVLMTWDKSPRPAQRVLYVKDRWIDSKGRPMALVHPEPLLALVAPRIKRPIWDFLAQSKSRRPISDFGFGRSLELIIKYCDKAQAQGVLDIEYKGRSSVDGRSTYVFVRQLPYTGDGGPYPDRVLIVHLDQETLLPIAVDTYADDAETELLGKYRLTDVEFNVGLSQADFTLN